MQQVSTTRDPYQGVLSVLTASSLLATLGAVIAGMKLVSPALLAASITLWVATGVLLSVLIQRRRASLPEEELSEPESASDEVQAQPSWIARRLRDVEPAEMVRNGAAFSGILAALVLYLSRITAYSLSFTVAAIAALGCVAAAGLTFTAARYLQNIDPSEFTDSAGLCRMARMLSWVLILAAISLVLAWAWPRNILHVPYYVVLVMDTLLCYELVTKKNSLQNSKLLEVLGSRTNIGAAMLDYAERRLGIDLRSTWALSVVRRSLEPIILGMTLLGWLSTSLTVIGVQEQALVQRFGALVENPPLQPGLHLHYPWPVDRVIPIPVQRVQVLTVGHEGLEEEGGPEDVVWASEHAPNEYTLLLGNGRDLITIDAAVQFRIKDPRTWQYQCQNPADALRAIAYRAVMRSTVNRTLSEALSENVVKLTEGMRSMVQTNADALGLGVEVVAFTVGGMHPPVMVASEYQAVVSAEVGKVTSAVNAQAFRNQVVPEAEASVLTRVNGARAEAANALARATGEAWSFRTLVSQYGAAPGEYVFRRRLETLENQLSTRRFVVVDARIQRDGGELWIMP